MMLLVNNNPIEIWGLLVTLCRFPPFGGRRGGGGVRPSIDLLTENEGPPPE